MKEFLSERQSGQLGGYQEMNRADVPTKPLSLRLRITKLEEQLAHSVERITNLERDNKAIAEVLQQEILG